MATIKKLGLTVEDYIDFIHGKPMSLDKEYLIMDHLGDSDFPWSMPMKTRVTFTGIDERTSVDELMKIQDKYPEAEFGLLVAKSRADGTDARYPGIKILTKLLATCLRLSCHVCGSLARSIIQTGDFSELDRYLCGNLCIFNRIQLNISDMDYDLLPEKISFRTPSAVKEIIIQQHPDKPLFPLRKIRSAGRGTKVSVLYDGSGGRGIECELKPVKSVFRAGYAGGINPSNAFEKFLQIKESGLSDDFWIDMETGVRTDGWFDVEKVKQVLEELERLIR